MIQINKIQLLYLFIFSVFCKILKQNKIEDSHTEDVLPGKTIQMADESEST